MTKSFIDSRSYSSSGLLTTLQIIWILWIFWTPLVALKHLKPHIGFQQNNLILLISFLIQDLCQSVGQSLIVSDWRALRACSCKGTRRSFASLFLGNENKVFQSFPDLRKKKFGEDCEDRATGDRRPRPLTVNWGFHRLNTRPTHSRNRKGFKKENIFQMILFVIQLKNITFVTKSNIAQTSPV